MNLRRFMGAVLVCGYCHGKKGLDCVHPNLESNSFTEENEGSEDTGTMFTAYSEII
jgi:hypothetical protein